ncbi:hypothetical protein KY495_21325 [Massilia sp. PAMC28688]|uniref:hypothetical protein n=1 Tax=Massilia sp. PAMC28688 TaxID=2861283 RepID=UPI001C639E54|nr:hypothetical protein [Massilia sp. PAMC28688]QYF93196.1 hypothetical protein KY495_21325 [Massilia sp. PAMC28688]
MNSTQARPRVAPFVALALMAALVLSGPIAQPHDYHAFADQRALFGIARGADVLSNFGFLLVAAYGLVALRRGSAADPARPAYAVFFAAIGLTAIGSGWYHLAPDDARLLWDRMPIAVACAALLAATMRDACRGAAAAMALPALVAFGIGSVLWWSWTGDLRYYLLIQGAPLVLIPVLQWQARAPMAQRTAFFIAIVLYVWAKLFEVADHAVLDALDVMSGHTIKHVLATLAAFVLARQFARRSRA